MNKTDKIYVAGHRGLVGSQIVKKLKEEGYKNICVANKMKENELCIKDNDPDLLAQTWLHLDLTRQSSVESYFSFTKPDYVFLAAAKVGGIYANSTYPADFTYNNLMVECNVINACYKSGVKKLLYLGSSCFRPGTLVSTSNGFKNIEDIKIGDEVLTHKNNFKKVHHLTKKEYVGNLKRIKFFGWGDIFCTPEHEILTKNGYKRADELNQEDYVLIPLNIPKDIKDEINMFDEEHKIMYNSYKDILSGADPKEIIKKYDIFKKRSGMVYGWKRNKPQYSHMKSDILDLKDKLSELCGYFLAEGWLSGVETGKRGGRHDVMLSPGYDKRFAEDIRNLMENIFGIKTHFGLYKTSYKVGYHSNKMAFKFFKQFYSDENEHKAHTKMIPEFIMNSSNDSIKQLIKAYWRGDGHYTMRKDRDNGQYIAVAASTSKILIYQLQQLLLRFKIITTINFKNKPPKVWIISKKHNDNREVNQRVQWELKITGKYAIDFIENVLDVKLENKFPGNEHYSHYYNKFSDNYLEVRFRKSTDVEYNGYVYDLSVEEDISYTANGVAVHNCIYPRDCPQPIKEEYLLSGPLEKTNDGYAIAKIAGIIMAQKYNKQYGTNNISLMPTNLYGSAEHDNYDPKTSHVLPGMIRKFHDAKMNKAEFVELWGTGSPFREFLHVSDLADAAVFLMNHYDSSEIINVGSGEEITIKNLALMIKEIVGFDGELRFNSDYPDGTPRKFLDSTKLMNLGWKPKIGLYGGIKSTYDEIIANNKFE